MILVNSPHNPTGSVFTRGDLDALAGLVRGTGIVVLSDEVYEHIVFDGARHESVSRHPELAPRSFVVGSFGKTFHVTGWKVGWALAPRELMAEFRKVHQFVVFTVNTPVQLALADFMSDPRRWLELPAFYQRKRDLFRAGLAATPFDPLPCAGTYFQLASYRPAERRAGHGCWPSGSPASSASPPSRSRPSSPTAARTGCCASASPSRTRPWNGPASGWPGSRSPELEVDPGPALLAGPPPSRGHEDPGRVEVAARRAAGREPPRRGAPPARRYASGGTLAVAASAASISSGATDGPGAPLPRAPLPARGGIAANATASQRGYSSGVTWTASRASPFLPSPGAQAHLARRTSRRACSLRSAPPSVTSSADALDLDPQRRGAPAAPCRAPRASSPPPESSPALPAREVDPLEGLPAAAAEELAQRGERSGHELREEVPDGLPDHAPDREVGVVDRAAHGDVDLDHAVLVGQDGEPELHGERCDVRAGTLLAQGELVDAGHVLGLQRPGP